jgi:hypothetical protein
MKTGGITASDKRDFGLDLRFTHRKEQFLDDQSNVQLEVLDVFIDYTVQMALDEMPSTGKYRKPSSAGPTCIAIPGHVDTRDHSRWRGRARGRRIRRGEGATRCNE